MRSTLGMLATVLVLSVLACETAAEAEKHQQLQLPTSQLAETSLPVADAVTSYLGPRARAVGLESFYHAQMDTSDSDSEGRKHTIKIKKKKPKTKKIKKFLKKFLPFLLIPLIVQAKLIPLFLFKLKLLALKAFGVGKLALLLVVLNLLYTAAHGNQDHDQVYTKEVNLASEHYGYNGGTEIGTWINRRYAPKP